MPLGLAINGGFKFQKDRAWSRVQGWMEQCFASNSDAAAEEAGADQDVAHGNTKEDGPRRSTRMRRPNTHVQSPAWA